MKKIILYLFCFLFLPSVLVAQEPFFFTLTENTISEFVHGYNVEKIIDARENRANIGYIYRLNSKAKIPVLFKNFIDIELGALMRINSHRAAGRKTMYIRINRLFIYEEEGRNYCSAFIDLTFIEKRGDELIELFTASSSQSSKKSLLIHENNHINNISEVVISCINAFNDRSKRQLLVEKSTNLENLLKRDSFKIPSFSKIKKGIYKTYYDLKYDTPDTLNLKDIVYLPSDSKNKLEANILSDFSFTKKAEPRPWGFSDGINFYIKAYENAYYPLENINDTLIFYAPNIGSKNTYFFIYAGGGIIGGIASALITIAINEANNEAKKTQSIAKAAWIDPESGLFRPYWSNTKNKRNAMLYLVNYEYPRQYPLRFFIDDEEICTLPNGAMTAKNNLKSDTKVCVQLGNNKRFCKDIHIQDSAQNILVAKVNKKGTDVEFDFINEKRDLEKVSNHLFVKKYNIVCPF